MKQFTIRLLEPILDAEARGRIAVKAAAQLGGTAEKLEQLMAREAGSRIARAGSAPHAERVATILRNAGLTVEVVAPDQSTDEEPEVGGAVGSSAPAALLAQPGMNADDPPFLERRAKPEPDPFGLPFMPHPASAALETDPFAEPSPSAAGHEDPFAPPTIISGDPFAAPTRSAALEMQSPSNRHVSGASEDPFAAYGSSATGIAPSDDLPPQARRARDRKSRRTSVGSQVRIGLIAPALIVMLGTFAYLSYIVPVAAKRSLEQQASNTSYIFNSVIASTFSKLDDPGANKERLDDLFVMVMRVPRVNFAIVKLGDRPAETMSIDIDEAKLDQAIAERPAPSTTEETSFELSVDGQEYTVGISPIHVAGAGSNVLGHLYVGLKNEGIALEVSRTLVPIFIGLLIALGFAVALASGMAARLVRPILAATDQANRISLGDLDRQIEPSSNDEIGDLLNSLERMRVSLKSMVSRLRRAQENP